MNENNSYEIPVAVGKEISSLKVFREDQDREVIIAFSDGTELEIKMEVRSVTSAILYQPTGHGLETLDRYDESPSEENRFSAVIRASREKLDER